MNFRAMGFFAAHQIIGSRVRDYLREFIQLHEGSTEAIIAKQSERLEKLLKHAQKSIPFYKERTKAKTANLADFPIVTKEDLVKNYREFMEPQLALEYDAKSRGYGWAEVKTGGTTGVPVTVIHDKDFRDRGRASRLFSQYLCGFPLGTPYFWLWGDMVEINHVKSSISKRALHFFLNTHLMNAFRMTRERIKEYVEQINGSSVQHMMAYVDAAAELARVAKQMNLPVRQLESVMACAGTVTEDFRTQICPYLAKRIQNKYGSRECTDMACETMDGELSMYAHHTLLEIVDDNGKPVPAGKTGRILVTLLGNHSFPVIRYEIGDMGALSASQGSHRSPWPLMDKIEGRITDFATDTKGDYVSPVFIRHLIGVMHNPGVIERYQLRQLTESQYEILLKCDSECGESQYKAITSGIEKDIKEVLGHDARIDFSRVAEIAESKSGKFLYIQNLRKKSKG